MSHQIKIPILAQIEGRLKNLAPLYKLLASDLHAAVEKDFKEQGRPRWTPLAKSTVKDRQRKGYWPGKILQRQGGGSGLLGSITEKSDGNSAVVGTNKVYAGIHQFGGEIRQNARSANYKQNRYKKGSKKGRYKKGTTIGRGQIYKARIIKIPARPFLMATEQDINKMQKTVTDYLLGK